MSKTLQELTIIDDFMFGAVMSDSENCRLLLERILDIRIDYVEVIPEKQLHYHPEYKGIRLDVYAKDDENTHYDVEMQVYQTPIGKRSRYYHAQMDMELLVKGTKYEYLPAGYVIFICNYDPFGMGKFRYTIHSRCEEVPDLNIKDGIHTIVLNNKGTNPEEVTPELVQFLKYTNEKLEDSEKESTDAFIRRIQQTIHEIKSSREMEVRYMAFEDIIRDRVEAATAQAIADARAEAKAEAEANAQKAIADAKAQSLSEGRREDRISSILDILSTLGTIPTSLKQELASIQEMEILRSLTFTAVQSETIEEFTKQLHVLTR